MPKKAAELGSLAVKNLQGEGMHPVGGVAGLHLNINRNGARSWILRLTVAGKRREIGLGGFPDVPLAEARSKARQIRIDVQNGINPSSERTKARDRLRAQLEMPTFAQCAARYIEAKRPGWKNAKHAQQWENTLATYAMPIIGLLPINQVELRHVVEVLHPIWTEKPETADRVAGRIRMVWEWAKAMRYVQGDNPADKKLLDNTLSQRKSRAQRTQSHPAVQLHQAAAFMRDMREKLTGMGALALQFTMLTGVRSNEARGAHWDEIDLISATWTIPAKRMKADRPHRVPLSRQAIELLEGLPRLAGSPLVFPSPQGHGKLSDMTMTKAMKQLGYRAKDGRLAVPHGLRSTLRDWLEERVTGVSRATKEMMLSHSAAENQTEAAYLRTDLLEQRRPVVQRWADFLDQGNHGAEVLPFKRSA